MKALIRIMITFTLFDPIYTEYLLNECKQELFLSTQRIQRETVEETIDDEGDAEVIVIDIKPRRWYDEVEITIDPYNDDAREH